MTQAAIEQEDHDLQASDANEAGRFDFEPSMQRKIATLFMRDNQFALKAKDLIKPEYFTETAVGQAVAIVQKHLQTYKAIPDVRIAVQLLKDEIKAKRIRDDIKDDVKAVFKEVYGPKASLGGGQFTLDRVRDFARHQAMQAAILASVPALEKGDFQAIEKHIKQALSVGRDTGSQDYDYWKEIENRTKYREDLKNGRIVRRGISTGYPELDVHLYHHGWGRQELSAMMGAAKAGKSMSLGDFGKNASLLGYNVFYASCEVSTRIIAERTDANIAEIAVRDLHMDPNEVERRLKAAAALAGEYRMRDFASGTLKVSQLARILDEYRDDGVIFDLIIIDYADIMAGEYKAENLRDNLREIYIDLRALAHEQDAAMLTATQTNRAGAQAATAKATDVGDDWNKARTADVLIGINATDDEKLRGEARLYWALSRNTEDGFQIRIQQDRAKMKFIKKVLGKI